jgi:hypothetical protein
MVRSTWQRRRNGSSVLATLGLAPVPVPPWGAARERVCVHHLFNGDDGVTYEKIQLSLLSNKSNLEFIYSYQIEMWNCGKKID